MAGVEDEDEFRDADDGAGTAPPPSSSPASTPSKSKPAAAAGGFGRRLLASIGLPTSFSAAIGRPSAPSSPKLSAPQPRAGPNLGLGFLLHEGPNPSAGGSLVPDASACGLHLLPTADLHKHHVEVRGEQGAAEDGEDKVIGHDDGVGEEQTVLVRTEEEGQGKDDVAAGCSGNRYGYSVQDQDKEGEQHKSSEFGAAMEDQEVMEQEEATEYHTAVEDQSNNNAEQCIGNAPTAIKDDSAVEGKKAMGQGCAVGVLGVAEDGVAGGLQEEDGFVEGQCEDDISVQDQHKVVEPCRNDEPGVTIGDGWLHDLDEVVVGQEGVTDHFDAAVEDQSNNAALERHSNGELGVIKVGNAVEDREEAVEQKGAIGILGVAEDGIAVGLQKEVLVVEDQGEEDISVQDQDEVVEQCMSGELGVPMGDSAVHDQEVVVVKQEGVTKHFDTAVEDEIDNAALGQCTSDELRVIKDGNAVEDKETAVEQEAAIDILGATEDGVAVGLREEDVVVEGQCEHGFSVQDQDNVVEQGLQGMRDELVVAMGDSAVHDQELLMVKQEGLVECFDAAMENQCNKAAMEQCTSDELREVKNGNFVEEKVKTVEQEGAIGLLDAAEDDAFVREEDVVVEGQGEDDISVQDEHKVVDQSTSDESGVAVGGNAIHDHDLVVYLVEVTKDFKAVVEDQSNNATVDQCTHDESITLRDGSFVDVKEKAVQQVVIDILGAAKDGVAVQSQEKKGMVEEGQGEDGISKQYQYKVVEQCTSDELQVVTGDITIQDQEVILEQEGITEYFYTALEDHSNNIYMSEVKDGNVVEIKEAALEQEGEFVILRAAENSVAVGLQGEDHMVVEGQGKDDISIQDQYKVVEQCNSVVQDQEVAVLDQEGVNRCCFDAAVKDQSNNSTVEQCTSVELEAAKDGDFVEEKEKVVVVEEDAIDVLGSAKDDVMGSQEGEVVMGDVISLQDQYKVVEQCISDQVRTTTDVNAAHDQEVVEQEGAIFVRVVTMDGIAIDAQEKVVKHSAGEESRAIKDTEDKEKVVDQGLIDKQDAIKGGSAPGSQGDEGVAVTEQGEDGVSVRDQDKVVEQCTSDQWRTTMDDNAAEAPGSQGDEGVAVTEQGEDGVSVRDQDKVVEQCTSDQWRTTMDDNAAEAQEVRREKIRFCVGYPQRPGRPNCRVYMSTGSCSYGLSCYLNHPQDSSPQFKAKPEVPSFPSEQGNHEVAQILELNRVGLPIRENARNCTYYMRNGHCRYGKRCCFNHPEHVLDVQLYKPTGWDDTNLPSSPHLKKSSSLHSKKSFEHATVDVVSSSSEILPPNILRMLLPPQSVLTGTEAKEMEVKKDPDWSSASDDSDGCCSADSSGGPLCKEEHHVDYPERPSRQECPFLLRHGNCKFASSCQYYHPTDKFARRYRQRDPALSEELMVYPDRPGAPECPFYMKTGACKFGTECKFHHPKDLPPSLRGPTISKKLVDAKELHPEIKTTQYHMDQQQNYPERPGQPECRYYMQFGKCKFLSACIFHHPKDRIPSMPECPFYMKTGTCQFGSACEFYHSSKGGEIDDGTGYGHDYPQRAGGNECFHFMKHGYCKFQMNCKYHHPTDRLSRK